MTTAKTTEVTLKRTARIGGKLCRPADKVKVTAEDLKILTNANAILTKEELAAAEAKTKAEDK